MPDAPIVYGFNENKLRRLKPDKIETDSSHHNNQNIKMAIYAREIEKVISLDSLSEQIHIYNVDCSLHTIVRPSQVKEQKEIIILSFSWSNTQKRLGACLKDFSLVFWDALDDFQYQKMFSIGGVTFDFQTEIWYIEFLDVWITTDRSCAINLWNLEEERIGQ